MTTIVYRKDHTLAGSTSETPVLDLLTILRLYNPLQPFFDKSWRPSEIEALD